MESKKREVVPFIDDSIYAANRNTCNVRGEAEKRRIKTHKERNRCKQRGEEKHMHKRNRSMS
jgi:hypothetical protein